MARAYSAFSGSLLVVAMRWIDRLIGIVSTLILARILVPDDFGVIAMASLVIAFADILLNFGVHVPLIQNQNADQKHYDAAWTIRCIQGAVTTVAVAAIAPFVADYFGDERVQPVLQLLALSLLLACVENIGTVDFQKHMQFGAELRFRLLTRLAGFFATVAAALLLRSYWAFVVGTLTGRTAGVVLSYVLHPMRPRLGFARMKEIFSVSQWMFLNAIGRYLQDSLHRMFVGRWAPTETMGAYTLADEIAAMPAGELLAPVNRVLFPAFAKVKHDLERLKEMYLLAQGVQAMIAVPAAAGLALVSHALVPTVLGPNWQPAIAFLEILALVNVARALTSSGGYVLVVIDRFRLYVLFTWSHVILFVALISTLFVSSDALTIAWLRLGIAVAGLWLMFWLLRIALPIVRMTEMLATSLRPLLGAGAMWAVLALGRESLPDEPAAALIVETAIGAAVYVAVVLGAWLAAGRPSGPESYLLDKLRDAVARGRLARSGG